MISKKAFVLILFIAVNANCVKAMANDSLSLQKERTAYAEYLYQLKNYPIAPYSYWQKVAKCETRSDWKDHGSYAGGLGIYTNKKFRDAGMGTWERWGGEDFAPSPDKATVLQQIVIANRISVIGWKKKVTRKDKTVYLWKKSPVGYLGWGCIKNIIGLPQT